MGTLVLLRHGESLWNREKRFTGWTDIGLSPKGVIEAQRAAHILKGKRMMFDLCFSSVLSRAHETATIVLKNMDLTSVPVRKSWRLNERHYGALQGMTWWEASTQFGAKQVLIWQRHFSAVPHPNLHCLHLCQCYVTHSVLGRSQPIPMVPPR